MSDIAATDPIDRRKRTIPWRRTAAGRQCRGEAPHQRAPRLIDPTTCERDYDDEETLFMKAMDRYKRENRRPFPTGARCWKC